MKVLYRFTVLIFISCTFLQSCKKDKRQYSQWYVNSEGFSTNEVEAYEVGSRPISFLRTTGHVNGFSISFGLDNLPTSRSSPLANDSTNPHNSAYSWLEVYYNGKTYHPPVGSSYYLNASTINGKAQYDLALYWFMNKDDSHDSVLIRGTFSAP